MNQSFFYTSYVIKINLNVEKRRNIGSGNKQ